ncbi:MAG TPA: two-component regulator propeller domain-containing protein [Verrucomicrobiae bacterium]|nr:two-component regulator propeller domain-containing protein [Verrucomicrobiae bacterium]
MLIALLITSQALALDPTRSIFQYNCQSWHRQNGLPANGVNAIAQTKDGYLWLGTPVGMVRFDGSEFKQLDVGHQPELRSSIVTTLFSSPNGGLWFGLERGAFGFCDGRQVQSRGKEEGGGVSQNVHAVLEASNGTIWVAAETESGMLSPQNTYEILPSLGTCDVTSICEGSRGRIWLGTTRRGLYYWQKGTLNKVQDDALDERIIRALAEDGSGNLWVGTELGALCYDSNFQKKQLPWPWYETRALHVDSHGMVWAGTSGGGIARYVQDHPVMFRQADGLADDFVLTISEDQEGSIWVGTRNGLSQFSDVKIPTFGKTEGLTADVNISVSPSHQGGLWVATTAGATWLDPISSPMNPVRMNLNNDSKNMYVKQVFEAKNGDVYLTDGSMNVEVFSQGKLVATYPNQTWPSAIAEDAHGVVIAVGGELYRASTNSFVPYAFNNDQKPQASWVFNMITDRDGGIWIASSDGIFRVKDGAYTEWTKQEGLADSKAISICEDRDGVIWAGLETGIARIKNGRVRNINRDNGLFDNIIYSIVPDDHGSLWVASGRGFYRVSLNSLNDFADGKTTRVDCDGYDGMDAVKSFERNQQDPSGCKTRDGRIWFPTAQGVAMMDPTNITRNPVPPPVYIHTVQANGRELEHTTNVTIRPGKGELEFHYAGLSYIAPQKIEYRYKLDGYEKDWVKAGTRHSAFYTNLKPGNYTFHVQACNADGVWGSTGASFSVVLLPHFYENGWFIALIVFAVVLLLAGIYGWRMGRLRRKQKKLQQAHDLLEKKVKERTAELAASNTSLKTEIEERKRVESEVDRIHRQLVDASRLAGQAEVASSVLHNVGNVLNSVNVSTTLLSERLQKMRLSNLLKAVQLIRDNGHDLARFITTDEKGSRLPDYLHELAQHLRTEQNDMLAELNGLSHNVEHIKEIVAMQQNYAKVSGTEEKVEISELVEGALKMHSGAYLRHSVKVLREYEPTPTLIVDRHKVLQILINVFANAKYACDENGRDDKIVNVRIKRRGEAAVAVEIRDNGIGITEENLTRIFSHGFTTRKNGHGFGLHSSALAAKEMGGMLTAQSEGLGKGAAFILELPLQPKHLKSPAMALDGIVI